MALFVLLLKEMKDEEKLIYKFGANEMVMEELS